MFQDTGTDFNSRFSFRKAVSWRNGDTKEREFGNVGSPSQAQMKSPKDLPSSAFKVYDKVLEKHRYIPRKWTQKEFEAAFPERFIGKTTASNFEIALQKPPDFNIVDTDGFDIHKVKEKERVFTFGESKRQPSSSNPRQKAEIKQKTKNLKAILEKAANSNVDTKMNMETEDKCGKGESERTETEELERCKDSEAKVKLLEEEDLTENQHKTELIPEATENGHGQYSSFLDACLQCLLNIEPFVEILSNANSTLKHTSSPIIAKLRNLLQYVPTNENTGLFPQQDLFPDFCNEFSECKNCDEVLVKFLEILIEEIQENTGEDGNNLHSLIQGQFCHIKTCERCTSLTKESELFLFLNPTTPLAYNPPNKSILDINYLSCGDEGSWYVATKQFVVTAGMRVCDLKEDLLSSPEFRTGGCDSGSVRIGEVNGSELVKIYDDEDDLWSIQLGSTSSLFAFHLLNYYSEDAVDKSIGSSVMSYHLYFNCGLCLSDGSEGGLFIHKNCGGMVCRDCLDVIAQSYQDWELCPCPICERPIDLDKELCKAKMNAEPPKELHSTEAKFVCEVTFRADKPINGGTELFGYPLMISLPQQVTGHHLYRSIGYLLPNALPMKDRTSFTLHIVDKPGHRCSTCSLEYCNGCLLRIDDNVIITHGMNLVVHFNDLAEESMKCFGISKPLLPETSSSQGLFDGILQSCVRASTSARMTCSKCDSACKVSSSIAEFPQLLLIHLNQLYADAGLPPNTTIADVSRFQVLQHGDRSTENAMENLTYQLTAVALATDERSPTYKVLIPRFDSDTWMLYGESFQTEVNPYQLHVTRNSVLFYQPVKIPTSSDHPKILRMPSRGNPRRVDTCQVHDPSRAAYNIYSRKLATISEETAAKNYPKISFKKADRKQTGPKKRPKIYLEPGEYFPGIGLDGHRGLPNPDIYSSQLSLGEISREGFAAHMSVDLDGISPISAQELWKGNAKLLRETKKLIRAVKREDAYGIVCSLKRGANPCLLINDVSALHLAAGIKSDQRCSMIAYLLKYSNDVNVPTGDGTTPVHVAAAWGHQVALEQFLAHGGDAFDITDQEGNSAFDLASRDCSSFLQLLCDGNSPGSFEPSTSSRTSLANRAKTKRLEDIVRSNVTLPSFVHEGDTDRSRLRLRWLKRFRSFRNKSSGVLKSIRRMSSIKRRSRIGIMVPATQEQSTPEKL